MFTTPKHRKARLARLLLCKTHAWGQMIDPILILAYSYMHKGTTGHFHSPLHIESHLSLIPKINPSFLVLSLISIPLGSIINPYQISWRYLVKKESFSSMVLILINQFLWQLYAIVVQNPRFQQMGSFLEKKWHVLNFRSISQKLGD